MIKIATLNVKGLNNRPKAQKTLTLLKTYNLDIIMLQETNLNDIQTREFLAQQWSYDSIWSSKTAILAGKKNIKLTNSKISQEGRIIIAETEIKQQPYTLTNVYAPPNQSDRIKFLRDWTPESPEGNISIIAGDFNTNLEPQINRISQAAAQNDPSREILRNCLSGYTDLALFAKESPFITFHQSTCNNQKMATRLDYIFIDEGHSHLGQNTCTRFGNSDHLLVESELNLKTKNYSSPLWKFDKKFWGIAEIKEDIITELQNIQEIEAWDLHKCIIKSITMAGKFSRAPERNIQKLHKKQCKINNKIAKYPDIEEYKLIAEKLNLEVQEELSAMSEKWRIRSNTKWIEEGEKSTKYFFMLFKKKQAISCCSKIQNAESPSTVNYSQILNSIKDNY